MDSDPYPDWTGREPCEGVLGRRQGTGSGRERYEEGVALRVHLDSTPGSKRRAQHTAVLAQRGRVLLGAQLVQQTGRPLHVGEEEGDGPARKLGHPQGVRRQEGGVKSVAQQQCSRTAPRATEIVQLFGAMFWLKRKTLSGSYWFFSATSLS